MNYTTFEPHDDLSPFIKCYWVLDAPKMDLSIKQRIVPDGCMEMIFHYGDIFHQYLNETEAIPQPRSFIFGQITRPLYIEPTGSTGIFAVRFHPDGFIPFATLPIRSIRDRAVALEDLFGRDGLLLAAAVIGALNNEVRIRLVESFLIKQLGKPDKIDHVIKSSVEVLMQLKGHLSVTALSGEININRRQLERRFSAVIGISPKQLSKVFRLQAALKILISQEFDSFADLAYQADYFDQSHFIKDFQEFTGVSPAKFYGNGLQMSSLFLG